MVHEWMEGGGGLSAYFIMSISLVFLYREGAHVPPCPHPISIHIVSLLVTDMIIRMKIVMIKDNSIYPLVVLISTARFISQSAEAQHKGCE